MFEVLLSNKFCSLQFKGDNNFFEYGIRDSEKSINFSYPAFEIDGKTEQVRINHWRKPVLIEKNRNGISEYLLKGISSNSGILMNFHVCISDESPIIRFSYELHSELSCWITKNSLSDNNAYFGVNLTGFDNFKEVRLSEFIPLPHTSYISDSETVNSWYENSNPKIGPMFIASEKNNSFFISYEHDLQFPERSLHFQLNQVNNKEVQAIANNSLHNQVISRGDSFETVWFEMGGVNGAEEMLASEHMTFIVKCMEKPILKTVRA